MQSLGDFSNNNLTWSNNDVIVAEDIHDCAQWKLALIEIANHSLEISGNFCGGLIFRNTLSLIQSQLHKYPALRVHLLISKTFLETEDVITLKEVKKYSVGRFVYLMTDALGISENHAKCVVVDDYFFDVGGTGIQDNLLAIPIKTSNNPFSKLLPPEFNDIDVIGRGILAQKIRSEFFNLFQRHEEIVYKQKVPSRFYNVIILKTPTWIKFENSKQLIKSVNSSFISCHPNKTNEISKYVSHRIDSAKKIIRIAHMSFNPQENVKMSLEVRDKSVKVELTSNSTNNMASFACGVSNRKNYHLVDEVLEMQNDIVYHKKVIQIDDQWTLIGSYNFSKKSHVHDDEFMIIMNDERVAKVVNRVIENDHLNAVVVNSEYSFISNTLATIISPITDWLI